MWSTKSFVAGWNGPAGQPMVDTELVDLVPTGSRHHHEPVGTPPEPPGADSRGAGVRPAWNHPAGGTVRIDTASRSRPLSGYLEERARGFLGADQTVRPGSSDSAASLNGRISDFVRTVMFRVA